MAEIKLVRVDYRLIHGQVVARWLKVCPVRRIVLVDDVLGSDEFMSDIYKMAVPKGTDVDIVTIDKAKDKIDNDTGGQPPPNKCILSIVYTLLISNLIL